MTIITDSRIYHSVLSKLAKQKHDKIIISTLGIYCGINNDGSHVADKNINCRTDEILRNMVEMCQDVNIVINIPKYFSCSKDDCVDCAFKYVTNIIRHINHIEYYSKPHVKWYFNMNVNLKGTLFYSNKNLGLIGGRNLTNSEWIDYTVSVTGKEFDTISAVFDEIIDTSEVFSTSSLENICHQAGISDILLSKAISN